MTNTLSQALDALRQGRATLAARLLRQRLADDPADPDALNLVGMTELDLGRDDVPPAVSRSLAVEPGEPAFLHNLGLASLRRNRLQMASAALRRALVLAPAHPDTHVDLGNLAARYGDYVEAGQRYACAVTLSPDHLAARQNRGWARLALGDFALGFNDYAARWRHPTFAALKTGLGRPWGGQPVDGTLLLFAEQGFGDTLQFCRLAQNVLPFARRVVLEVQPELATLLRRSLPSVEVISRGSGFPGPESRPPHDVHAALLDLPRLLGIDVGQIPAATSYLIPDPKKVASWAARLRSNAPSHRRVGLVWAGSPRADDIAASEVDRRRSLSLADLGPLAAGDISFFSLQIGPAACDVSMPPPGMQLTDLSPLLADFDETAAVIMNLDLVVTVDTAVAHLAGALGRTVWVLSRCDHCWRWLAGRDDSPWYPSLRLFRQRHPGDWGEVLVNLAHALKSETASPRVD